VTFVLGPEKDRFRVPLILRGISRIEFIETDIESGEIFPVPGMKFANELFGADPPL
jgi:hypothetical protein